jgi:hypothetical protein
MTFEQKENTFSSMFWKKEIMYSTNCTDSLKSKVEVKQV